MADGLEAAKEPAAALECYQKLLALGPSDRTLDRIDKTLVVRRDRWVQGRLAELRQTAGADLAVKIDELARRCDAEVWPALLGS